jgi:ketosteroid isomerase-like protein
MAATPTNRENMLMGKPATRSALIALAEEYYRRADAGRPDLLDLFTEDVELFFPKFGVRRGKAGLVELANGLAGSLKSIEHDRQDLSCVAVGQTVLVEGTTHGETCDGTQWEGGNTPGGRFCSVFEFRGNLISRMYIYLDPDYGSADRARFLWPDIATRLW